MKKMILFFVFLVSSASLFAQPMRELVFFGDSLTDNGNLYNIVKFIPKSPPYYKGRFTNGPVWADDMSVYYNAQAQNYGVGGATAVPRSIFHGALPYFLKREVNRYLKAKSTTDKNSVLYLFWIGANDYMDEPKKAVDILVKEVVDEIVLQIQVLIEHGGKNFVIINLPNLSEAPFAKTISQEQRDRLKLLSQLHHEKLLGATQLLQKNYPGFHFIYIDTLAIFNDMRINIQNYNQKYNKHIVNLTEACWLGGYTITHPNDDVSESIKNSTSLSIAHNVGVAQSLGEKPCNNPDDYLFWDAVHPSVVVHEIFASMMIETIENALAQEGR